MRKKQKRKMEKRQLDDLYVRQRDYCKWDLISGERVRERRMNTQINVSEKRESKKVTNKPRKRELMVTNVFLMQKKKYL